MSQCLTYLYTGYFHNVLLLTLGISQFSVQTTVDFVCVCVCLQAVRPHAPLIKFPNRQGIARPDGE